MRQSLILMRRLQPSLLRFKITKLCFGILDGVNTFARAKVLRSVTPRPKGAARFARVIFALCASDMLLRNVIYPLRGCDIFRRPAKC